ncbi:monofunctional biosynthetic peptidoglycan transglycosylase [Candidimonas nitroreducens]|uniref:Biosynthetic peptidoglycan transglycosylase n=1 Tax=Candidimonas nitroreducens TaxID=683354 RepID=A0A225MBZ2_9BURK|nr:monofunctional biosynthetic peptidoglycan transglycosylase [Candidimonas nitroreducens]OWT58212.1 monofunctional biosynthetic peptidoglycan transglycosylase [Candidimonas nitroreducens]
MGRRKPGRRGIFRSLLAIGVCALLLYELGLFAMIVWYKYQNPGSSAFMAATLQQLRATDPHASLQHRWVPYAQISTTLKRAVIASEDSNFTGHDGVEWSAIRQAWAYNLKQEERGTHRRRGGSTITQQLAKNLFLSDSRSYLRKAQELALAYMLELVMSKRRILELYLNLAQWGTNVFGAEAAARHYYHVGARMLNSYQAARLASMLPNPDYYDRHRDTAYLRRHARIVQRRMHLVDIPGSP